MDQQMIQYFETLRTQNSIYVACIALWLYEYLCMFLLEVQFIWNAPWGPVKSLYLLTRYSQFFLLGALTHQAGASSPISRDRCLQLERFIIVMIDLCTCSAEIIFTVRTWAVWGRTRKSGIILAAFFVAFWVTGFVLTGVWFPSLTPSPIPVPPQVISSGCYNTVTSPLRFVNYALILPFYLVTLSLMAIRAYESFANRKSHSDFVRLVFIDGILYYIYLMCLSIMNIIIIYTLPTHYSDLLTVVQQFLGSILACRLILNIRSYEQADIGEASSIRFGTRQVHLMTRHDDAATD